MRGGSGQLTPSGDGGLHHPAPFLETILSGADRWPPEALSRLGLAARDPIDELLSQRARVRAERACFTRPLPRLVRARRGRDQTRPVGAARCGAGDDRARRQGLFGYPGLCYPRSIEARRCSPVDRASGGRRQSSADPPPEEGGAARSCSPRSWRRTKRSSWRSIGGCSTWP